MPPTAGELPDLPSLTCVKEYGRRFMQGPTPWSNWAIPCRVLAGAYPATPDDAVTRSLLTRLMRAGVDTFVCLQAEVDITTAEKLWRAGKAVRCAPCGGDACPGLAGVVVLPTAQRDDLIGAPAWPAAALQSQRP
jgi:hypothetical protein